MVTLKTYNQVFPLRPDEGICLNYRNVGQF